MPRASGTLGAARTGVLAEARQVSTEVYESAERAVKLLDDLLDLSKLDASRLDFRLQKERIDRIVDHAVRAVQPTGARRSRPLSAAPRAWARPS